MVYFSIFFPFPFLSNFLFGFLVFSFVKELLLEGGGLVYLLYSLLVMFSIFHSYFLVFQN